MTKFVPWIIWLFLFFTLVWPRPWPKHGKIGAAVGLTVLIFPYHILRWISDFPFGDFVENWPHDVWLGVQFLYCSTVFLCLIAGLDLLLHLVSAWYAKSKSITPRYRHQLIRFRIMLPLSAVLTALGIYFSLLPPLVREYALTLEHYPAGAGELRIAAVSDLHFDPVYDFRYAARIVEKLNGLKPDVILLLGDYSNTPNGLTPAVLAELKKLSAPEGVFAVTGNHEYYPEGRNNFQRLSTIGIRFLCNESVKLKRENIYLVGVNDPSTRNGFRDKMKREQRAPLVGKTVKNIPPGSTVILLSHQPELRTDAASNGIDLQLSGHIHGGLFPVLRLLWELSRGPAHGFYRERDTGLIVSSGTGIWCGFPCRFGILPEVLLVRISGRD